MPASNIITDQNRTIVELILQGMSQREVAKKVGLPKTTLHGRLKREDIKAFLDYGQQRNAMRVPRACDKLDELLDSKDEGIRLKAIEILKGQICVTLAPARFCNNIRLLSDWLL